MAEYVPPEAPDAYVVYDGADLPAVDADSVLLETRYIRTTPRDTGAAYDLGAWLRADRARRAAVGSFDAGGRREIVVPAWRCEPDDLPTKPKALVKRLLAVGWDVRFSTGTVYVTQALYVGTTDSHTRGDVKAEDHDDTWWSVQAVLRTGGTPVAAFWACWTTREQVGVKVSTKFDDATTHDLVLGREFTKSATSFEQWLAVFAPPPPKPAKKKAVTSA